MIKAAKYKLGAAQVLVQRLLEPGDAVLEIGAADGCHTDLYAARVGPAGCVVSVEPHPAQLAQLEAVQQRYAWLRVLPMAVGSHTGAAILRCDGQRSTSSLYRRNVGAVLEMYPVPLTTVDAIVVTMPAVPHLIHLDAQGAEVAILRGARRTLGLPIAWVVEVWRDGLLRAGASVEELLTTFRARGFAAQTVHGEPWPWPDLELQAEARRASNHFDVVLVPA